MSRPVKVLHCIPTLGGGGAERQLSYLTPALCARGVDVHVAAILGGVNESAIKRSNVMLHWIPSSGNHDPRIVTRLLLLARRIKPDLIQTWIPQMDIVGGVISCLLGIPHVLTERCSEEAYGSSWKDGLRRFFGRWAMAVVANSEWGRAYWSTLRPKRLTVVIRNGVPMKEILSAESNRVPIPKTESLPRVVLAAGRFTEQKNFSVLLSALEEIFTRVSDSVAVICGEGPMRDVLVRQAQAHPFADRIRIHGFAENLWGLLKEASVFVSPSLFEGSPNTVLEAMAANCPLVVSEIPPHREILGEESALFVDPRDPRALANAICTVLEDGRAARRRVGCAASRVAQLSVENSAGQYLALYQSLVGSGGSHIEDLAHEVRYDRVV
ncbi:MAG: glycosyltransferase family 4 protein [Nitrospirota bacterium]